MGDLKGEQEEGKLKRKVNIQKQEKKRRKEKWV